MRANRTSTGIIAPRLDTASLTRAHVAITEAEREMRLLGRQDCADALSYADLVILIPRNRLRDRLSI